MVVDSKLTRSHNTLIFFWFSTKHHNMNCAILHKTMQGTKWQAWTKLVRLFIFSNVNIVGHTLDLYNITFFFVLHRTFKTWTTWFCTKPCKHKMTNPQSSLGVFTILDVNIVGHMLDCVPPSERGQSLIYHIKSFITLDEWQCVANWIIPSSIPRLIVDTNVMQLFEFIKKYWF
jgi:hypothetical protein